MKMLESRTGLKARENTGEVLGRRNLKQLGPDGGLSNPGRRTTSVKGETWDEVVGISHQI